MKLIFFSRFEVSPPSLDGQPSSKRFLLAVCCLSLIVNSCINKRYYPLLWYDSKITIVNEPEHNYIEDIDGNVYKTAVFGTQEWMLENLRTTRYNNGFPIGHYDLDLMKYDPKYFNVFLDIRKANDAWMRDKEGAFSFYHFNEFTADSIGALYNWYAVNNPNGLCPTGWGVPDKDEWELLFDQISTYLRDSFRIDTIMDTTSPANMPPIMVISTTFIMEVLGAGFNANSSAVRHFRGEFFYHSRSAHWWSSGEQSRNRSYIYATSIQQLDPRHITVSKNSGIPVRCVRNLTEQ